MRGGPWAIGAAAVLVAAWFATGELARRARAAALPPPADLSSLTDPAREQVRDADARARAAPASADAVGDLGRAYHASLMTAAAIAAYLRAEALDPASWRWTYLRGLLLEERGETADARAAFTRVVERHPGHGLAWFKLAELAFKEGRLDEAENAYRRAAEAPPAAPFTMPGVTSRRVAPLANYATAGLSRIAAERNGEPGIRSPGPGTRSRAYVPPSDPALDAIVASSTVRDLLLKHAAVAARGGDSEWREALVRRAWQFNPRDPSVVMEMASMLQASNRATEALDLLKQHEALVPGDHHTLVEAGRSLADLGRLDEAEAVLRRAVQVRDAAAEYNLATVLDRQGRADEARAHYEEALAIDPFHTRALNNLGVWLDRRGQNAAAVAMLRRAVDSDPDNAESYSNLGTALIGARRLGEALKVLDVAVALAPGAADAHNNRGIALAQAGRLRDAVAEFEAAVRLDPAHANARRNLEQLSALRP